MVEAEALFGWAFQSAFVFAKAKSQPKDPKDIGAFAKSSFSRGINPKAPSPAGRCPGITSQYMALSYISYRTIHTDPQHHLT